MKYIQRKDSNGVETVDQCETLKEARCLLNEYRLSDPYAEYYISQRATKEWRESQNDSN